MPSSPAYASGWVARAPSSPPVPQSMRLAIANDGEKLPIFRRQQPHHGIDRIEARLRRVGRRGVRAARHGLHFSVQRPQILNLVSGQRNAIWRWAESGANPSPHQAFPNAGKITGNFALSATPKDPASPRKPVVSNIWQVSAVQGISPNREITGNFSGGSLRSTLRRCDDPIQARLWIATVLTGTRPYTQCPIRLEPHSFS